VSTRDGKGARDHEDSDTVGNNSANPPVTPALTTTSPVKHSADSDARIRVAEDVVNADHATVLRYAEWASDPAHGVASLSRGLRSAIQRDHGLASALAGCAAQLRATG
jgi:hypothetical protein